MTRRSSEVWQDIKPFAMRDFGDLFGLLGRSTGNSSETYAILLYDISSGKVQEYSVSEAGLTGALAAAASGDIVWMPSATITLTAGITIPAGVYLIGDSREKSILYASGAYGTLVTMSDSSGLTELKVNYVTTSGTIAVQVASNSRIHRLLVDFDPTTVGTCYGIYGNAVSNVELTDVYSNCTGNGGGRYGVRITFAAEGWMKNVKGWGHANTASITCYGIYLTGTATKVILEDCEGHGQGQWFNSTGYGIYASSSNEDGIILKNCLGFAGYQFGGTGSGTCYGIYAHKCIVISCRGITETAESGNVQYGIYLSDSAIQGGIYWCNQSVSGRGNVYACYSIGTSYAVGARFRATQSGTIYDIYVNSGTLTVTFCMYNTTGGAGTLAYGTGDRLGSPFSPTARGDMIAANATPVWSRLALGGATGSVLTRDATDPVWSGFYFTGTAGKTITFTGALTIGADTTITGGGTLALGGFTATIPATGTVALLATANIFTAAQTINVSSTTGFHVKNGSNEYIFGVDTAAFACYMGATPPITQATRLHLHYWGNQPTDTHAVFYTSARYTMTSDGFSSKYARVFRLQAYTDGSYALLGYLYAFSAEITTYNSGNVSNAIGMNFQITNYSTSTATISNAYGVILNIAQGASGVIYNGTGINLGVTARVPIGIGLTATGISGLSTTAIGLKIYDITLATTCKAIETNAGLVVINEGGDSASDMRVEGDTDTNLLFTDASADKVGIGTSSPTSKLDIAGDAEISSDKAYYFGDPTTNDTWRIVRSGNNLEIQRRESGSYVAKQIITA